MDKHFRDNASLQIFHLHPTHMIGLVSWWPVGFSQGDLPLMPHPHDWIGELIASWFPSRRSSSYAPPTWLAWRLDGQLVSHKEIFHLRPTHRIGLASWWPVGFLKEIFRLRPTYMIGLASWFPSRRSSLYIPPTWLAWRVDGQLVFFKEIFLLHPTHMIGLASWWPVGFPQGDLPLMPHPHDWHGELMASWFPWRSSTYAPPTWLACWVDGQLVSSRRSSSYTPPTWLVYELMANWFSSRRSSAYASPTWLAWRVVGQLVSLKIFRLHPTHMIGLASWWQVGFPQGGLPLTPHPHDWFTSWWPVGFPQGDLPLTPHPHDWLGELMASWFPSRSSAYTPPTWWVDCQLVSLKEIFLLHPTHIIGLRVDGQLVFLKEIFILRPTHMIGLMSWWPVGFPQGDLPLTPHPHNWFMSWWPVGFPQGDLHLTPHPHDWLDELMASWFPSRSSAYAPSTWLAWWVYGQLVSLKEIFLLHPTHMIGLQVDSQLVFLKEIFRLRLTHLIGLSLEWDCSEVNHSYLLCLAWTEWKGLKFYSPLWFHPFG